MRNGFSRSTPLALDLFSGIGGLTLGLHRAGVDSVGGVDCWEDAAQTFEQNVGRPCLLGDLTSLSAEEICAFFGVTAEQIDVLVGGPPCQGFSTVGKRDAADPRNRLWRRYLQLVSEIRPAYVLIENVEGLVVMDRGRICDQITASFGEIGYEMRWKLLVSADYGVPQLRKRVIFLGWLEGLVPAEFPRRSGRRHVTVGDAIFDLPELTSGDSAVQYDRPPLTRFQRERRKGVSVLSNHRAANHPPHLVEILTHIPDGGNRKSIPDALQPRSGFHNSYARLASDKPAVAVTSNMRKPSSARATHPTQHRGLTVREGLRLQTFDDDFVPVGSRTSQYLQVGNAVPPLLGQVLGRSLLKAFKASSPGLVRRLKSKSIRKSQRDESLVPS